MTIFHKITEVEAITFDELVQIGIESGATLYDGFPWAFSYKGFPITHENNDCYLISTNIQLNRVERNDMLVFENGSLYPCNMDYFNKNFKKV